MTYTFKLARRLAVSRRFSMLPAILLFAACNDDATAPGDPLGTQVAVAVSVNPRTVTIETNQLIRFLAYGRTRAGDSVHAPITWRATGGIILPDGRFSSGTTGKFLVTGAVAGTPGVGPGGPRGRDEDHNRMDTSIVEVVRRWPLLQSIEVTPEQVTLAPGGSQAFHAIGRLKDGRPIPVGTVWDANGGTIDAGGNFIAGDTAGTYKVIATNWTVLISDTALVTITAPPAPPAPEEPPAPPVLATLTLVPASATLAPSTMRQFAAYGTTTTGDSLAVSVVFTATGGTVTAGGLYTAGGTGGNYRVIATSGGLTDTSSVTVTKPLGSGAATMPFGPFELLGLAPAGTPTGSFTLSLDSYSASNIVARIDAARGKGLKLVIALAGGAHSNYITNGVFDLAKWNAKLNTFNTPTIKAAIARGVEDGTIVGSSVMDEPQHPSWGGVLNKLKIDQLCANTKSVFPTLPTGVVHKHFAFDPTHSYNACDFIVDQYNWRHGDVNQFRDEALAMGARDKHAVMFSMNILDGGIKDQDNDGVWECPIPETQGQGTFYPNCRMTAAEVRNYGMVLGAAGCGLLMWRYDNTYMARPDNQQAFRDVGAKMASIPAKSCRRS